APFSNRGDFRAFLALNRAGQNDYSSGLTVDQGFPSSPRFQILNPEGAGFGGAVNLLKDAADFGTVQRLAVTAAIGKRGTRLYLTGKPRGRRARPPSVIHMARVPGGARYYTNGGPPQVRGFLQGDILEVLVYSRALGDAELAEVDRYLTSRHGT